MFYVQGDDTFRRAKLTTAATCAGDYLLFSLDMAAPVSDTFWYLIEAPSTHNEEGDILNFGISNVDKYPFHACLPQLACYELWVYNQSFSASSYIGSSLLCSGSDSGDPPAYIMTIDGVEAQGRCFRSANAESIAFGSCDVPWQTLADGKDVRNVSEGRRRNSFLEGDDQLDSPRLVFIFVFLVILAFCLACCGCVCHQSCYHKQGRHTRSASNDTNIQRSRSDSNGVNFRQAVVLRDEQAGITPPRDLSGAATIGPTFGSQQRKAYIKANLVTHTLTASDICSFTSERSNRMEAAFYRIAFEGGGYIRSSIQSLGLRVSTHAPPSSSSDSVAGKENSSSRPSIAKCGICLEEYTQGDVVCCSSNPSCIHGFHANCMSEWLLDNEECPNCRVKYFETDDDLPDKFENFEE